MSLADLYNFKGTAAISSQNLDALRKADVPAAARSGVRGDVHPLTSFVGPVVTRIGARSAPPVARDVSRFIDLRKKIVRSFTGEVAWDYGKGVVTVDTPRTQGALGFLSKAGRIELGNVVIECANEYASILVTSLDGKPIASSRRMLVQAVTEERHYGWRVEGGRITNLGGPPLNVRRIDATVTLKVPGLGRKARVLDEHGYARTKGGTLERAEITRTGRAFTVKLPADAMYTVIE